MNPIDLRKCLTSGQVFRWREVKPGVWEGNDGSQFGRLGTASFGLQEDPSGKLKLAIHGSWHQYFRLDEPQDLQSHIAEMCPKFASLPRQEGLRLLRPSDPVESFFSFLCTSNNHLGRITKMVEHLFPLSNESSMGESSAAGDPERLLHIPSFTESELRAAGFGYRAATIPRAAQLLIMRGGRQYLLDLRQASLREAQAELLSFPGVGPKLADCIALYALHNTEAVPVDVHLWNGAVRLYFREWRGTTLTDKKYQAIGDHFRSLFGPWAGHAQLFVYYAGVVSGRSGGN
ncbi:MAG: hypothetical protein IT206_01100 [Fimbriimonadaceae bacterium]|nr:hypothetical protein [Fimbriimonadaceae bacterium]